MASSSTVSTESKPSHQTMRLLPSKKHGAMTIGSRRWIFLYVNLLDLKAGSISWRSLLLILLLLVSLLQVLAFLSFHDAMYSPLNPNFAEAKHRHHDDVLLQARRYVERRMKDYTAARPTSSSSTSSGEIHREAQEEAHRQHHSHPFCSMVIITSQRKHPYLDVLLWSLLEGNDPKLLASTPLSLLNVERPPSNHRDLPKWQYLLPDHVRFINASSPASRSWALLGVLDYRDALQECQRQNQSWCIVVEEDTLLTRNLMSKFQKTVVLGLSPTDRIRRERIAMVKLFVTDYYSGFGFDRSHIRDMAWMGLVSIILVVLLFSILPLDPRQPGTKRQARRKQLVATFVVFCGVYGACRLLGRQTLVNLIEPQYLHLDSMGESAGTVGIAFPQSILHELFDFINRRLEETDHRVENIDVLLNRWTQQESLRPLRTRPSLVQHMGAFSSATHKNQGNFEAVKQDSGFVF